MSYLNLLQANFHFSTKSLALRRPSLSPALTKTPKTGFLATSKVFHKLYEILYFMYFSCQRLKEGDRNASAIRGMINFTTIYMKYNEIGIGDWISAKTSA